jgi:hypothetical protein
MKIWTVVSISLVLANGVACGSDEEGTSKGTDSSTTDGTDGSGAPNACGVAESSDTRCIGSELQVCTGTAWVRQQDCATNGGTCEAVAGLSGVFQCIQPIVASQDLELCHDAASPSGVFDNPCESGLVCSLYSEAQSFCLHDCSAGTTSCETDEYCETEFFNTPDLASPVSSCWRSGGTSEACLSDAACAVGGQACFIEGQGVYSECQASCPVSEIGTVGSCTGTNMVCATSNDLEEEEKTCTEGGAECTAAQGYECMTMVNAAGTDTELRCGRFKGVCAEKAVIIDDFGYENLGEDQNCEALNQTACEDPTADGCTWTTTGTPECIDTETCKDILTPDDINCEALTGCSLSQDDAGAAVCIDFPQVIADWFEFLYQDPEAPSPAPKNACNLPGSSFGCGPMDGFPEVLVECAQVSSGLIPLITDISQSGQVSYAQCLGNFDCLSAGASCLETGAGKICAWIPHACMAFCETEEGVEITGLPIAGFTCELPKNPIGDIVLEPSTTGADFVDCTNNSTVCTDDFECEDFGQVSACARYRKVLVAVPIP